MTVFPAQKNFSLTFSNILELLKNLLIPPYHYLQENPFIVIILKHAADLDINITTYHAFFKRTRAKREKGGEGFSLFNHL